jgi:hypothetical protein
MGKIDTSDWEAKYVVVKVDDLRVTSVDHEVVEWEASFCSEDVVYDAVVIRRQDVFAPPALDAYASSIRVAVDLMAPGPTRDHLKEIADYFHEQAVLAWDTQRKVPD